MSFNPKPSYHLCPSFTIPPPPKGHINLGSIIDSLDSDGVENPVNIYCRVEVPKEQIYPRGGPDEKRGFTRTLKELRAAESSIWAKIFTFGSASLGFLRERSDDEELTVDKLSTRYFSPSMDYMQEALGEPHVVAYIEETSKRKPLYMVTGYMYVEGAKLSKARNKQTEMGAEAGATEPNSGTSVGANGGYAAGNSSSTGFDGSTPFILGIRLRKIWWDRSGTRRTSDKVAGSVLGSSYSAKESILEGIKFEDDAMAKNEETSSYVFEQDDDQLGVEPSNWVILE